jgi:hypothetical protein
MASSDHVLGVEGAAARLDLPGLVVALVVLALVLVALVPAGWRRWSWRRAGRTGSVVVAVLAVVVAAGAVVNRAGNFYPTVGALVPGAGTAPDAAALPGPARTGNGSVTTMRGPHGPVAVYLPAGYSDDPGVRYPALLWISDGPVGTLPGLLDGAVAAGRIPPVVVVVTRADDVARVRHWALGTLRVRPDRPAWALAGPPIGPPCAFDVGVAAPADYATVAGRVCDAPPPAGPEARELLATAVDDSPADVAAADRVHTGASPDEQTTEYVFEATAPPESRLAAELQWIGGRLPGPVATGDTVAAAGVGGGNDVPR